MSSGVKQDSAISQMLFIILLDQIVKVVDQRIENREKSAVLIYADDVWLVVEDPQDFEQMINLWNNVLKKHGLKLNLDKTQVTIVRRQQEEINIYVDVKLKQVTWIKYFGVAFDQAAKKEAIEDHIVNYNMSVNL